MQGLIRLVDRYVDVFADVRGLGLMLGLKCKIPNTKVLHACYDQNLITVPAADNIIRLLPPLNISDYEINEAIERLGKAAQVCASKLKEVGL